MSENHRIDLYYAAESAVSLTPNVPYAWQFRDEQIALPSSVGNGTNCFALLARDNRALVKTTDTNINAAFIFEQFEQLSLAVQKPTVVVLDNASSHHARIIKERTVTWQRSGLYLFYLPRYSPHLNIVETLWRKLKYEWLAPTDYQCRETLRYAVDRALKAVGASLHIAFSGFNYRLL